MNTLSQCRLNETKDKLEGTTLMFVNGNSGRGYFLYYFVFFQRCFSCPFMFHMCHIFLNQHPGHSLDFLGGGVGFFFHTVVVMSGFHDFQGGTFLLEVGLKCATGLYLFNTVASCMFPCYTRLCFVKLVLKNCTMHFPLD